jgi:hypothetical protein
MTEDESWLNFVNLDKCGTNTWFTQNERTDAHGANHTKEEIDKQENQGRYRIDYLLAKRRYWNRSQSKAYLSADVQSD